MNALHLGLNAVPELPKTGGYLLISDEVPDIKDARVFDPLKHCFNPFEGMTEKKARRIAEVMYQITPGGEGTLTVRNGIRALPGCIMQAKHIGKLKGSDEVESLRDDILFSPVLRRVFTGKRNFFYKPHSKVVARINRAELGDFDAKVLTFMLMEFYDGQLVVPDFGFYGRDVHASLIREQRLICGVTTLDRLPKLLRTEVLLIPEKVGHGCTFEDATVLAQYARMVKNTVKYNEAIDEWMH